MSKRLITLMATLLLLGFVVAGCGGDDEPADTVTDTVTDVLTDDEVVTDTDTVTDETDTTDTTDTTDGGGAAAPRNVQQAVARCKAGVNAAPQLSQSTKDSLQSICEKAASGDAGEVREAAQEVCREIVQDTMPQGTPGRAQALQSCTDN